MRERIVNRSPFPAIMKLQERQITLSKAETQALETAHKVCEHLQSRLLALKGIDPDYDCDYLDDHQLGPLTHAVIALEAIIAMGPTIALETIRD